MKLLGGYIGFLGRKNEEEIERSVTGALPEGGNLSYLDLGCGDGGKTVARGFKIGTKNIIGIEAEAGLFQNSKDSGLKMINTNLNTPWPVGSASIDCITATEVIEHLSNLDIFFSESKRVLKKGGKIIISTENLAGYHNILALLLGNQPYTGPYLSSVFPIGHRPCANYYKGKSQKSFPHLNVMTAKALQQLLIKYGFKVRKIKGIGFYPLPPFAARVFAKLDGNHASYCVAVAEK